MTYIIIITNDVNKMRVRVQCVRKTKYEASIIARMCPQNGVRSAMVCYRSPAGAHVVHPEVKQNHFQNLHTNRTLTL